MAALSKSLNVCDSVSPFLFQSGMLLQVLVPKFLPANVVLSAIDVISVSNAVTSAFNAVLSAVSAVFR